MARYTYGDSDLAGDRLALVARLFRPTSEAFLRAASPREPDVAVDLGCGPGHTTALVHETAGARRTVGVDRSELFARRARDRVPDLGFIAADVARGLPADRAGRSRLRPAAAGPSARPARTSSARWSTILTIGGRVLVDDLEAIETDDDVFRRYLDDVALAVIRAQGGALFVGPALHGARDPAGLVRVHDEVVAFAPAAAETARVFAMNLAVLTERGEVSPRADLATALEAIASGVRTAEPVRWRVRQLAWERSRLGSPDARKPDRGGMGRGPLGGRESQPVRSVRRGRRLRVGRRGADGRRDRRRGGGRAGLGGGDAAGAERGAGDRRARARRAGRGARRATLARGGKAARRGHRRGAARLPHLPVLRRARRCGCRGSTCAASVRASTSTSCASRSAWWASSPRGTSRSRSRRGRSRRRSPTGARWCASPPSWCPRAPGRSPRSSRAPGCPTASATS